jgi:hypothetical protein
MTIETVSTNVGNLFEVIAKTEHRMTGMFDASLNRTQAQALANAGYSLKPGQNTVIGDRSPLDILITTESEMRGMFRAALARQTAKELAEAGCSF